MALLVPVAGPFTSTYAPGASAVGATTARSQGITSDDGYTLVWTIHKQRIGNDGTDRWGLSLLESVYRGADWSNRYRCREWSSYNFQVASPYAAQVAAGGGFNPAISIPGVCDDTSGYAGIHVMTAVSGTPASASPATLTASHAIIADSQQYDMMFTSKLRELPIYLNYYPYAVSSGTSLTPLWFVTS